MTATKKFIKGELIGRRVKVIDCTDRSLQGIEGHIVDETKHMLTVETTTTLKKIAKNTATFDIDGRTVNGQRIRYRPEDRIRKIK
jgi:ribonuclease P protein subunit POP4